MINKIKMRDRMIQNLGGKALELVERTLVEKDMFNSPNEAPSFHEKVKTYRVKVN